MRRGDPRCSPPCGILAYLTVGGDQVISGLERAVRDMAVGETKPVRFGHRDAYGDVRDDMIAVIPKERFPNEIEPEQGMMFQMQTEQGALPVEVVEVSEKVVTVDGHHPLAGKDLTFELALAEVAWRSSSRGSGNL